MFHMNLYITRSGRLSRKDNTLSFETFSLPDDSIFSEDESEGLFTEDPEKKIALPIENIDGIYVFSEITMNSKLMNFLGQKKVPVHIFNYYGNHTGTFLPHAEQLSGDLVIRQSEAYRDQAKRLSICRAILDATFHNILSVLQYYQRRDIDLDEEVESVKKLASNLTEAHDTNEMMAIEGNIRRIYYSCWWKWLGETASDFKRKYHPPDNPLNALISFLNSLLYTACVSELYRTALYPGISYLHTPQSRRFSLALDMVEPFKPLMVDRLIFSLFNRNEISEKDFRPYSNAFLLSDEARKKILEQWEEVLGKTIHIDRLKRSVSYRQLLRLDCYKLIKYLIEDAEFTPYRIEY